MALIVDGAQPGSSVRARTMAVTCDAPAADGGCAQRLQGEGSPQVAQAFGPRQPALGRGFPRSQQQGGVGLPRCESPCDLVCLIEAAFAQSSRREGHRQHHVRGIERGLDPRCAAQKRRERRGLSRVASELELRDAFGPRPGIGAGREARIERRGRPRALAAPRNAVGNLQRAGRTARCRRRKARHARVAHRLSRPRAANDALAGQAVEQARERPFDPMAEHPSIY